MHFKLESAFLNSLKNENYKYDFNLYRDVDGVSQISDRSIESGIKIKYKSYQDDLKKIPGSPIAYWIPETLVDTFVSGRKIDEISPPRIGMMTSDNSRFLRYWFEVNFSGIGMGIESIQDSVKSSLKWFPYNKGGGLKKWAGLQSVIVNWFNEGQEISSSGMTSFRGKEFYFKKGLTWGAVSSGDFSCRYTLPGSIFDIGGASCFPMDDDVGLVATLLNSKVGTYILNLLNPTMNFQSGDIRRVPIPENIIAIKQSLNCTHNKLVTIASQDWDSSEFSWNFEKHYLIPIQSTKGLLSDNWAMYEKEKIGQFNQVKTLEEGNNVLFIEAYGLQGATYSQCYL